MERCGGEEVWRCGCEEVWRCGGEEVRRCRCEEVRRCGGEARAETSRADTGPCGFSTVQLLDPELAPDLALTLSPDLELA